MVDDGAADPRVERLLEQILESGDSPEEACRACPELLPDLWDMADDFSDALGELLDATK